MVIKLGLMTRTAARATAAPAATGGSRAGPPTATASPQYPAPSPQQFPAVPGASPQYQSHAYTNSTAYPQQQQQAGPQQKPLLMLMNDPYNTD